MNGKRMTALLLIVLMLFSLSGCQAGDYKKAVSLTENGDWQGAKEIFASLGDYEDAADRLRECDYRIALEKMTGGEYDAALEILALLDGYADSDEQASECRYQIAAAAMGSGSWDEAAEAFTALGSYRDSADMASECRYQKAVSLMGSESWDEAAEAFTALGSYKDSADMVSECRYQQAVSVMESGAWEKAAEAFAALDGYKDSVDMVSECSYRKAAQLMSNGDYAEAAGIFSEILDHRDAGDQYSECRYQQAMQLYADGGYEAAYPFFLDLGDYKDAEYHAVLSILQYDQQSFVDTFAGALDAMFKAGNVPLSMTESKVDYERDARVFALDRVPGGREVFITFEPSNSDGTVTSRGQISTIHITGDTEKAEDVETTLSEVMITSVLAMSMLDSGASPEALTVLLGEAYGGLLAKFPDTVPETGHFEKVQVPFEHYECQAAVSVWPGYYRFLFSITVPELVKQK